VLRPESLLHDIIEGTMRGEATRGRKRMHLLIDLMKGKYVALKRIAGNFGRYSFSVPLRVEGRVGLSGWLQTEMVYPPADGHPSHY